MRTIEQKIFDHVLRFMALVALLILFTSCSAAIPNPITPTSEATTQPTATEPARAGSPTPAPAVCTVKTGVPRGYLNLREGAGTSFAVIRVLAEGEALTVTARGTWLEVTDGQGKRGYVNSRYCN